MAALLYNKIRTTLAAENDRYILWVPALMGAGIAWYFHLKTEPPWWLGSVVMLLSICSAFIFRRISVFRTLCIGLALIAFGVALSQYRTASIHSPYLLQPLSFAHVSGKVVEIAPTPKGSKILLQDVTITELPKDKTPTYISLTLRSYDPMLSTGQIVSLRAGLFPPPMPALPGGFDFGRYFYFREIGAVGYGMPPMEVQSLGSSGAGSFDIWFAGFRHRLTESIRSHFHEPAGAVAAAFITGEVRSIPGDINDTMRIAGLYHLLAVSGMNLSVVAGLAFFSLRFLLAAIPFLAVRYNIKKWAALLALIASYAYLRVSGSPVSAERAFFMVSLVFIAILLDRDPSPMRSIAIAAFCIMLYEPEAALTASFQLSFSATAALVASYEWGIGWLSRHRKSGGFGLSSIFFYFAAVMATSFIAWAGTEPFIIYHFNQFSSYSLLANTIAEPLVSFLLMPLVIAGVLLMPLGLSQLAFTPMQYGVDLLLAIARWVAHLPHALWVVPNPSDYGFALFVFGIVWIYFWRTHWRWLGLMAVCTGMCTAFFYTPADLLVSADGKQVGARMDDGRFAMIKGRSQNMTAEQWLRAEIEQSYPDKGAVAEDCDKEGCIFKTHGHSIAVIKRSEALGDDCRASDIVISAQPVDHATCSALLIIDKPLLDAGGTAAIWFTPHGLKLTQVKSEQGKRPWVSHEGEDDN